MRVLIVDDDALLRRLMRVWLQARGLEVEEAEDGAAALARLGASDAPAPDVLVLDAMMPNVDGLEVLRRLRASEAASPGGGRRLPVLMLTAKRAEAEIAECRALGADEVLGKPLLPDALVEGIRRLAGAPGGGG